MIELFAHRVIIAINICCSQQKTKYVVSFSASLHSSLVSLNLNKSLYECRFHEFRRWGKQAIKMCESTGSAIDWVKGSKRLSQREKRNKKRGMRQWLKSERDRLICLSLSGNWKKRGQSNVWDRVKWEKCQSKRHRSHIDPETHRMMERMRWDVI